MGLGLRPGAKAPDQPPMPYRLRASPRLYGAVGSVREVCRWGGGGGTALRASKRSACGIGRGARALAAAGLCDCGAPRAAKRGGGLAVRCRRCLDRSAELMRERRRKGAGGAAASG